MKILISVILPLYNAEKYILSAINSVLIQTEVDFELIIIDDGSTDNSSDIVKTINDSRVKYYRKENGGIISALNFGLSKSVGNIIARMDADDVMEPFRLIKQLKYLISNRLDVVGSFINLINEDSVIVGSKTFPINHFDIISALPFFNPICHPSTIMRANVLVAAGGYRVGTDGAEDFDLWCKLSQTYKFGNIPEFLLNYRLTSQSLSRTSFNKRMILCRESIRRNMGPNVPLVFYSASAYFRHPLSIIIYSLKYSCATKLRSLWYILYGFSLSIYSQVKFRKQS